MLALLFDLLLPPRCGGCTAAGDWFCARCRSQLRRPREPLCSRCGRELAFVGDGCGCRRGLRSVSSIRSGFLYEGPLENAIHRFKYEGWRSLAEPLAELMAERLAIQLPPAGILVSVPLHRSRRASRGYNQSELLAVELRRRFRLRRPAGRLLRNRPTTTQVGLDRLRRAANVGGAFTYAGASLAGASVLLIDDVATTGATLDACAAALRQAGSGAVSALTLARVAI